MAEARGTLLVVDDEYQILEFVKAYFEPRGYRVQTLVRGDGVLEQVTASAPGVLLMDLKMPGVSGEQLLPKLRQACPRLPIIVMTAYNDPETEQRVLRSGVFAFVQKPFASLRELEKLVKGALERGGAEAGPSP